MNQLAQALKNSAEFTVQEWNDFVLGVTHIDDVHVNREELEGGERREGGGGGVYIDNQEVTEGR